MFRGWLDTTTGRCNVVAIQSNPAKRNEGGVSWRSIRLVASRIVDSRIRKCISPEYADTQKHVQALRGFMSRLGTGPLCEASIMQPPNTPKHVYEMEASELLSTSRFACLILDIFHFFFHVADILIQSPSFSSLSLRSVNVIRTNAGLKWSNVKRDFCHTRSSAFLIERLDKKLNSNHPNHRQRSFLAIPQKVLLPCFETHPVIFV